MLFQNSLVSSRYNYRYSSDPFSEYNAYLLRILDPDAPPWNLYGRGVKGSVKENAYEIDKYLSFFTTNAAVAARKESVVVL